MAKEFRYHPQVEGLRVNEDGSEIWLGNRQLVVQEYWIKNSKSYRRFVSFNSRQVTLNRLVCECWNGMAPNGDYSATQIDQTKGYHYTNIFWLKRGMKINPKSKRKVSEENHIEIQNRLKEGEKIKDIINDYPFTNATYCIYKRQNGKD